MLFLPRAFQSVMGEIKTADTFGTQTLMAVTKDWSIQELSSRSTPEFQHILTDSASAGVFDSFRTTYGPFKNGQSHVNGINTKSETGMGTRTVVKYMNDATFEKSSAQVVLTLVKRTGTDWKVDGIHINGVGLGSDSQ